MPSSWVCRRREAASLALAILTLGIAPNARGAEPWKPANAPLSTRWAKDVSPEKVLPDYPRPQLVRKDWSSLNGLWEYAIRPKSETSSEFKKGDGQILVPFPVESSLSGVGKRIGASDKLWYRRTFTIPEAWKDKRVLLHFGAVDWESTVAVNGKEIGSHKGGYDPFGFDVTDALKDGGRGEQELVVSAWDPSSDGPQPRGKQVVKPGGIYYTPTTGIWQTVWLEPVAKAHVASLSFKPDVDRSLVRISGDVTSNARAIVTITDPESHQAVSHTVDLKQGAEIAIKEPKLWSPDSPALYSVKLKLEGDDGALADEVESYFGLRKISLGKDAKGVTRILLNNTFVFQYGPLDQGFWPDGLYTAPTDEALKYDLEITKKLGFNMVRKHVKVEPARWYAWCDRLGLLVWQDMPSGGADARWDPNGKFDGTEGTRDQASADNYRREWRSIIDALRHFPSIVMWVPFNEGWGQFDTVAVSKWTKEYDPTRLVNCSSGGNDFPVGDVHDIHVYPGPRSPQPEPTRAAVLGEFGGLGLPLEGHTWLEKGNWGYRSFGNSKELTDAYVDLLSKVTPLIDSPGLSAAIYTQTTDVEVEVNGLMTYDRKLIKLDESRITEAALKMRGIAPASK